MSLTHSRRRAAEWASRSAAPQVRGAAAVPAGRQVCDRCARAKDRAQDEEGPAACGVGLTLGAGQRGVEIERIHRGGSADRHNSSLGVSTADAVRVGDVVLSIGGAALDDANAGLAHELLRGCAGSEVEIGLSSPSDSGIEGDTPISRIVRLMRGSPSFWHFFEQTELLRKEAERRKGAHELLKVEIAGCEAALAKAQAELQDSRRCAAALEGELNDARHGQAQRELEQSRQQQARGEADQEHERSKQELIAEIERLQQECSDLNELVGSQDEVREARRVRDDTARMCATIEMRVQDLQALLFRSLRQSRLALKEREAYKESCAQSMERLAKDKERRRSAERQLRQQANDAQQERGVLTFAAKALSEQLTHMCAEIDMVADSLAHTTRQQQAFVERQRKDHSDWAANALERERKAEQKLAQLNIHCDALNQDHERLEKEHALSLAFAEQGGRQCAHLEKDVSDVVLLMASLQDSTAGLLREKAQLKQQQVRSLVFAEQEERQCAHLEKETQEIVKMMALLQESTTGLLREKAQLKQEQVCSLIHAEQGARQCAHLEKEAQEIVALMASLQDCTAGLLKEKTQLKQDNFRLLAFAEQGARQCERLEKETQGIVALMTSLQDCTAGLVREKSRLHAQGELQKAEFTRRETEQRAAHAKREAEEKSRHAKIECDAEAAHAQRESDARTEHAQRERSLEARVQQLQELVGEREQVRDFMSQRALGMADLEQQLIEAHRESQAKCKELEHVKKEAAAELMRLLRIVATVNKQQQERDTAPQHCGVGVVLMAGIDSGAASNQFVVHDLIDGFSAAQSCALRKGDAILSIGGVDLCGKTEAAATELLHGPRGSRVRLICSRPSSAKPFGVCLRRGKWGAEHAVLTEEEADLHAWSQQAVSTSPLCTVLASRRGAGVAV